MFQHSSHSEQTRSHRRESRFAAATIPRRGGTRQRLLWQSLGNYGSLRIGSDGYSLFMPCAICDLSDYMTKYHPTRRSTVDEKAPIVLAAKGLAEGAKQIPTYDPEQRDRRRLAGQPLLDVRAPPHPHPHPSGVTAAPARVSNAPGTAHGRPNPEATDREATSLPPRGMARSPVNQRRRCWRVARRGGGDASGRARMGRTSAAAQSSAWRACSTIAPRPKNSGTVPG